MKKVKKINKVKLSILTICTLLFLLIIIFVVKKDVLGIDVKVYNLILDIKNDKLDSLMKFITKFGEFYSIIGIVLVSSLLIKNKKVSLMIILNLIISSTLTYLLKFSIQRSRPIWKTIDVSGFSFPSGHSLIGLAVYGFFIYLIYRFVKNKKIKILLISLISILIILVAFSRIYLGVHYFSDVVAGLLLSTGYLLVFCHFTRKYLKLKN